MNKKRTIAALFSGCGGLDLGFRQAGFNVVWSNEYDKSIWDTYLLNHPNTILDKRSIRDIVSNDIPNTDGIIGGPPCQSWSLAGAMRGGSDPRGQLFFEYVRILKDKKPNFFLAENVPGIISSAHIGEFKQILKMFETVDYNVFFAPLNAMHYGVPQDRTRVIIVGFHKRTKIKDYHFPQRTHSSLSDEDIFSQYLNYTPIVTLREAIGDLPKATPAREKNHTNGSKLKVRNHEFMTGEFSTMYMSRNRRRDWNQPSFTIQAGGRHAPLYPGSRKMIKIGPDQWIFDPSDKKEYRRLTVRECARVQTFPDDFEYVYTAISDGYKMVGNAVPVLLGKILAKSIADTLKESKY